MLFNICAACFGISTLVKIAKDHGAKSYIERNEKVKVKSDKRSFSEKAFDFLKDYFYLLVPGYNIFKSFQILRIRESEYALYRKSILADRERLEKIEEKEEPKFDIKKAEDELKELREKNKNGKSIEKPIEESIDKQIKKEPSLEERKVFYLSLDQKYRKILAELEVKNASNAEKNVIIRKLINVDNEYKRIIRLIEIEKEISSLNSEKENLQRNQSMKLVRK